MNAPVDQLSAEDAREEHARLAEEILGTAAFEHQEASLNRTDGRGRDVAIQST